MSEEPTLAASTLRHSLGRFTCLVLLPGLGLVVPFSSALTVFFSTLAVIFGFFAIRWRAFFRDYLTSPLSSHFRLVTSFLLFFLYLSVNAFFSSDPPSAVYAISKYKKILYLLVLSVVIIQLSKKEWMVHLLDFFLLGSLIVAAVGIASRYGMLTYIFGEPLKEIGGWFIGNSPDNYMMRVGGPDNPTVGRNHITHGAFTAFAVVYCWWRSSTTETARSAKAKYFIWGLSAPLILYVFLLQGRTGYVLMFVALICLLYIEVTRLMRQVKSGAKDFARVSIVAFIVVGTLAGLTSIIPIEQVISRSIQAINETVAFFREGATADGQQVRLDLWRTAFDHLASAPVFGRGVGSNVVYSSNVRQVFQPHSEALLILSTMGVVGLLLFANIIRILFEMCHGDSYLKLLLWLYLLDGSFNSVLWDLAEGHYFIVLALAILGYNLHRSGRARDATISVT